jgi:hypothetical protein
MRAQAPDRAAAGWVRVQPYAFDLLQVNGCGHEDVVLEGQGTFDLLL